MNRYALLTTDGNPPAWVDASFAAGLIMRRLLRDPNWENYEILTTIYARSPGEAAALYAARPDAPPPTVHLQGYGKHPAKRAGDLQLGDTIVCNYGSAYRVTAILKKTAMTITIRVSNDRYGDWEKRYNKSTLVAAK